MVMWSTKPGTNICLFCSSRALSRLQLENFYRRSYSTSFGSQQLTKGDNFSAANFHRTKSYSPWARVLSRQFVVRGRDGIRSTSSSTNARLLRKFRTAQYTSKSFKKNGRISGSRDQDVEVYRRPFIFRRVSGIRPVEDIGRNVLAQVCKRADDPVFRLEVGLVGDNVEDTILDFSRGMLHILEASPQSSSISKVKSSLTEAYRSKGEKGLASQLKFLLQAKLANRGFKQPDILNQMSLADFRHPAEWYPNARKRSRTIHLHIGPTNSGKTYNALKRLEEAKTGCYAGPLRLLAHEIYTRLNAKGKNCNLLTGDEIVIAEAGEEKLSSCTVEMTPLGEDLDVAVIDEIQMLGDKERGWAWTRAMLGIRAKELHLCGETRTLPLIREIAASLGEKLIVHNYERLSPLKVSSDSLEGRLEDLQKGDCIISFSRKGIHGLQKEIHKRTGKDVAIVYGTLPPETRAQQAELFNDPNNAYDVLVASDAIGMGLNLNIKRIIFETVEKYNGFDTSPLSIPHIKQIGGRAGRYRTAATAIALDSSAAQSGQNLDPTTIQAQPPENTGYVTTLHNIDLPQVRSAMKQDPPPMEAAGLKVPDDIIVRFASFFPAETPLSYILLRLGEISRMNPRYFICDLQSQVSIADAIQCVPGLTIHQRLIFCYAPIDMKTPQAKATIAALATCVANRSGGGLLDIPALGLEVLDLPMPLPSESEEYIMALANSYHAIVLYIWLSYRLNSIFQSQALAFHTKNLLQKKLEEALERSNPSSEWLENRYKVMAEAKQRSRLKAEIDEMVGDIKSQDGSVKAVDDEGPELAAYLEARGTEQSVAGQDIPSILPAKASFVPLNSRVEEHVRQEV